MKTKKILSQKMLKHTDVPARGGGLLNGLNSDDLDDDDYIDEDSEELMAIRHTGGSINRLGGQTTRVFDDSRHQSVFCMYINSSTHYIAHK